MTNVCNIFFSMQNATNIKYTISFFLFPFIKLPLVLISLIFEVLTLQLQIQQAFSIFPFEKDRSSCIEQAGKEKFTCGYSHSDKVSIAHVDSFLC